MTNGLKLQNNMLPLHMHFNPLYILHSIKPIMKKCFSKIRLMFSMGCVISLALTGCTSPTKNTAVNPIAENVKPPLISRIFKPFRPDIVQGNFISKEQLETVRVGMTKDQVKQLLGTPLLNDVYHPERWDYIFSYKKGVTQEVEQRRVTVIFNGILLASISGDELPSEKELIAEVDNIRANRPKANKAVTQDLGGNAPKTVPAFPESSKPESGSSSPGGRL